MALLTVAELREHVTTSLGDEALQRLLDAAEAAITRVAGPVGELTEVHDGSGTYVFLRRPVSTVTTVKEWLAHSYERTLDPTDFRVGSDGLTLRRLTTGATAATSWAGPVEVVYQPVPDEAERIAVQIALIKLFLNHHPGLTQLTIGAWSRSFASSDNQSYAAERDQLLDSLAMGQQVFA